MYNNVYQEYINNIIGMSPRNSMEFENSYFSNTSSSNMELERLYPDLYRLLYPMIQSACMRNTKPITEETIEEMVRDIYSNFNADEMILTNEVRSGNKTNDSKLDKNVSITSPDSKSLTRNVENEEYRNRRPNNFVLNDLIRILLIRELLGRPGNFPPNRPGFPFPGPGMRPPFRPRDINFDSHDYSIYEEPHMYNNLGF